jgi:signal transduction histidine kinase
MHVVGGQPAGTIRSFVSRFALEALDGRVEVKPLVARVRSIAAALSRFVGHVPPSAEVSVVEPAGQGNSRVVDVLRALEHVAEFVFILQEGRVRWSNGASSAAFGLACGEEARGLELSSLAFPEDEANLRAWLQAPSQNADGSLPGARVSPCYRLRAAGGGFSWVRFSLPTKLEFDGCPALLVTARDETLCRQQEVELCAAEKRRAEFLAMLSHELRGPLGPIRLGVSVLERVSQDSLAAEKARSVIERQTRQLERLVDDLLDVTRLQHGKFGFRKCSVDAAALASDVVSDHEASFAAAGVALSVRLGQAPLILEADPVKLTQAFGNLLQNALRFTPRGGQVTLGVQPDEAHGTVEFQVADSGVGIAPESLGKLFEPFEQVRDAQGLAHGGLGLGLAVVRGVADLHGGSVRAASDGLGCGATFSLILPLLANDDGIGAL